MDSLLLLSSMEQIQQALRKPDRGQIYSRSKKNIHRRLDTLSSRRCTGTSKNNSQLFFSVHFLTPLFQSTSFVIWSLQVYNSPILVFTPSVIRRDFHLYHSCNLNLLKKGTMNRFGLGWGGHDGSCPSPVGMSLLLTKDAVGFNIQ